MILIEFLCFYFYQTEVTVQKVDVICIKRTSESTKSIKAQIR